LALGIAMFIIEPSRTSINWEIATTNKVRHLVGSSVDSVFFKADKEISSSEHLFKAID
jgi:hypothetical protein